MITDSKRRILSAIKAKISEIPANNPSVIDFYPGTLRNQLSDQLLNKISEVAAEAAMKEIDKIHNEV